jgi:hypothetical protein
MRYQLLILVRLNSGTAMTVAGFDTLDDAEDAFNNIEEFNESLDPNTNLRARRLYIPKKGPK